MSQLRIPGLQYAVIRHNRIVTSGALGMANMQDHVPVDSRTIFPINSITKAFTGVAVMQLVDSGNLDLDAPVSRYLDNLPVAWRNVSIRRLVTHTSGLPDIWDEHASLIGNSPEASWQRVQALPIEFSPGEKFKYNQTNYVLIGMIIDKLSGQEFDRFINRRQFRIADMPLTGYYDGNDVVPHSTRIYTVYRSLAGRFTYTGNVTNGVTEEFPHLMRTAAGINSTATELSRWIIALLQGKLLKDKNSIKKLLTPGKLNDGSHAGFSPFINGYGVGWPMVIRPKHMALTPTGGGRSAFFLYPDDDLAIVVLTNLTGAQPDGFIDQLASLYIPDLRVSKGFGLSSILDRLRIALATKGIVAAAKLARTQKPSVQEVEINQWGYSLLEEPGQIHAAIEVFRLNVMLFPKSGNPYDSLAEAYEAAGRTASAIEEYRHALKINSTNNHAKERLRALLRKK